MNNIKDSIRAPKTIVIDSVQLRDKGPAPDRPLLKREPILETVNINTKSEESISKSELKIGDGDNKSTGIVTAYLKNKLVEISDDQITIKGDNEQVAFKIKIDTYTIEGSTYYDLNINDAFVIASSGQVKKMLISDDMIVNTIPSPSDINLYSNGQLLFVKGS